MIPKYDSVEFDTSKSRDLLPLKCERCGVTFYRQKNEIQKCLAGHPRIRLRFCKNSCKHDNQSNGSLEPCRHCNKKTYVQRHVKNKNHYCSHSCSAKYSNSHKTTGTRRSKLEAWLELQLQKVYPSLQIKYNSRDEIKAELDIYIPSLKLAFELNGIFHYEPIFGPETLSAIQSNDSRKFQACLEENIELCIIDASQQRNFSEKTSFQFLDIVRNIIDSKLG